MTLPTLLPLREGWPVRGCVLPAGALLPPLSGSIRCICVLLPVVLLLPLVLLPLLAGAA